MRYDPRIYARAFVETLEHLNEEECVRKFIALVYKNGDAGDLPKVFLQIERVLVQREGGRIVTVETARKLSPEWSAKIKRMFNGKDRVTEHVRPEIIAGVRIEIDGEREFDGSLKRKLDRLFV